MALSAVVLSVLVACPAKRVPCTDVAAIKARTAQEKFITVRKAVPGEYIVVLAEPAAGMKPALVSQAAESLTAQYGGSVFFTYGSAPRGFASQMTEAQARAMAAAPEVAYVQENGVVTISDSQPNVTWGIDRVDQHELPLDKTYLYNTTGRGVHVYIIDTGIRITHREFGGRADHGYDAIGDSMKGDDCHGHGTHVAGTVGGNTYGIAKGALLHAVRVLNCQGSGTTANVVAGVDWVTNNHQLPAVANMSLGGDEDPAIDDAVRRSIASGVTYVLAAGNENTDACKHSPARTAEAITVGATTDADKRAPFSNWGRCVDVFAPGNQITSAWHYSDKETRVLSGTSMASPHVAGVVALYLEGHPTDSPGAVAAALFENSTPDKVREAGECSPNRLTYSGWIDGSTPLPTVQSRSGTPTTSGNNPP